MSAVLEYLDSDAAAIPAVGFWVVLLVTAWLVGWRRKRRLQRDRAAFDRMMRFRMACPDRGRGLVDDTDPIEAPGLPAWAGVARRDHEEARERAVLDRRAQIAVGELLHRRGAAAADLAWERQLLASAGTLREVLA